MTASYPSMFVFGILLLFSWAGWGVAIERLVLGRVAADRALHAGWGMAFTVVIGGALNLAGLIAPAVLNVLMLGGLVLLAWDWWRRRGPIGRLVRRRLRRLRSPLMAVAALALAGMLVMAYAAKVCSKDYNPHDDLQGYFVFPAKMIQTGAIAAEPFSEARMLSLGGMSFLQAVVLNVADFRYVRLMEPGVALVLGVGLLLGVARDVGAGPRAAALAIFLFLAVPPPAVNAASLVTGLVLFLTLFRTLWRTADRGRPASLREAILVALAAAALCALKTTHVPATAFMVVITYLLRASTTPRRGPVIAEMLLAGVLTLAFLAPWMLASYASNGTLLFPVFGKGFHGSAYGGEWVPYESPGPGARLAGVGEALVDPRVAPLWILGLGLLVRHRGRLERGSVAAFVLAALLPLVMLAGVHPGVHRYSWAVLWAGTLTLLVHSWRSAAGTRRAAVPHGWPAVPLVAAVGLLAFAHAADAHRYWKSRPAAVEAAVRQSLTPGFKRGAAVSGARLLEAVPEGETLLARLRYPFALDFRRHTVFTANYPGGSSPPPGMPFFQGGEPLARYLCGQSVRYVAYSYRTEANFQRKKHQHRLDPGEFSWTRAQALHALDFQDNLDELGRTRRRIFDNDREFVIDLGVSADGASLPCRSG